MPEGDSTRSVAEVSVRGSEIQGRGVFANRAFRKDEIILEIDDSDPVLDRSKLSREQEIYIDVFVTAEGTQKTTWMKPPECLINHSCDPNTYVQTNMRTGVRQVLALKDLRAGDELTQDYALNIWEEWVGPVPCTCGAKNCRKVIQGNYFTLPREIQRRYLPLLDEPFRRRFADRIQALELRAESDPGD